MDRAALHERANGLRDDIARIKGKIAVIESPAFQGLAKDEQLSNLRKMLALRRFELDSVETQLSGG